MTKVLKEQIETHTQPGVMDAKYVRVIVLKRRMSNKQLLLLSALKPSYKSEMWYDLENENWEVKNVT